MRSHGYEPHVTVFSMCRPVPDLEKHLSLDDEGRVCCHRSGFEQYNVWSAFSMSYNGMRPRPPSPLARPLAQLPPFPAKKKRRRLTFKTTEAPADGIDKQATPDDQLHTKTEQGNEVKKEMEQGDEPPEISLHSVIYNQAAQEALEDVVDLFLTKRKKPNTVGNCFPLLRRKTRKYLCSLHKRST